MTNGALDDRAGDVVQAVNAVLSPAHLAAALSVSADARSAMTLARTLLEERDARGEFRTADEIRDVVDRAESGRFVQVASRLADLVALLGTRQAGLVDPESTLSELGRVDGGVVRRQRFSLADDRPLGAARGVSYEGFAVEVGLSGPAEFLAWVTETIEHGAIRRNGEIHVLDRNSRSLHLREFTGAAVTEVAFPTCDSGSTDTAGITVKFQPETIRQRVVDREPLKVRPPSSQWVKSDFWMTLSGTMPAEGVVTRIDSFSWAQAIADDQTWSVNLPDLTLIIAANSDVAKSWFDWFELYATGSSDDGSTGTISYLAANLQDEIARIELKGLRPLSLQPQASGTGSPTPYQFAVQLACDQLHFEVIDPGH